MPHQRSRALSGLRISSVETVKVIPVLEYMRLRNSHFEYAEAFMIRERIEWHYEYLVTSLEETWWATAVYNRQLH